MVAYILEIDKGISNAIYVSHKVSAGISKKCKHTCSCWRSLANVSVHTKQKYDGDLPMRRYMKSYCPKLVSSRMDFNIAYIGEYGKHFGRNGGHT